MSPNWCTCVCVAGLLAVSQASLAADKAPSLDEAMAQIKTYKFGESRRALSAVEEAVLRAGPAAEARDRLAARLGALLAADATLDCKRFVCRQLATLGSAQSVPVLAPLLLDEKLSDMARFALESIPGAAAGEALARAIDKSSGAIRIGLINSLGDRKDSAAALVLASLLNAGDAANVEAAIVALGKVGGDKASAALAERKSSVPAAIRFALMDAYLRCGDSFMKQGEPAKALPIYEAAFATGEPVLIRVAAIKGLVTVKGDKSLPLVLSQLEDPQPEMQSAALRLVRGMPGEAVTQALVDRLAKFPPERQSLLLGVLADRADQSALPAVVGALQSQSGEVRIAALTALGGLAGKRAVSLLAQAAADKSGAEQEAARSSLARLKGANVDAAILASLNDKNASAREELARAVGMRNIAGAVKVLLQTARDSQPAVRVASLESLAALAGESDVAALVEMLVQGQSDAERRQAGQAVVAVARRSSKPDSQIDAPLSALGKAGDPAIKAQLLRVVGEIGGPRAAQAAEAALRDGDAQVRDAAVRALVASGDASALPQLWQIAKSGEGEQQQVALQGYIRLLDAPSPRKSAETVAAYAQAFALAKRIEEKRQVLFGVQKLRSSEAIKFVVPLLTDKELGFDAARVIIRQTDPGRRAQAARAGSPDQMSREEAIAALKRVLETTEDSRVRQRVQMMLESETYR